MCPRHLVQRLWVRFPMWQKLFPVTFILKNNIVIRILNCWSWFLHRMDQHVSEIICNHGKSFKKLIYLVYLNIESFSWKIMWPYQIVFWDKSTPLLVAIVSENKICQFFPHAHMIYDLTFPRWYTWYLFFTVNDFADCLTANYCWEAVRPDRSCWMCTWFNFHWMSTHLLSEKKVQIKIGV